MGVVGYLLSTRDIFFVTAALGLPVLLALTKIRAADIHFGRSCGASNHDSPHPERASRAILFKDHRLLTFAVCLFLFQLANASMLPLIGEALVQEQGRWSSLVISALVVVPQLLVAVLAPWVGRTANSWGRRPLLLIGLGVVPIRSALFARDLSVFSTTMVGADKDRGAFLPPMLLRCDDLTALVIADITQGTGRFNLAQGLIGTLSGLGASLSTSVWGLVAERFGQMVAMVTDQGLSNSSMKSMKRGSASVMPSR